ncbi:MAG: hypothetical protein ACLFTK_11495 [Anaerolineales bacterium]
MPPVTAHLALTLHLAQDFQLAQEQRGGAVWLVARHYQTRFTGHLTLPDGDVALHGVYLAVESAMLPIAEDELRGYEHGVVSMYAPDQTTLFSGPFLKQTVGMRWQAGEVADYWTETTGAFSGEGAFAGWLLHVALQGTWQALPDGRRLVEQGPATLLS